jgi:diguanylate cyclase (GGDEF)-like protein
MPLLSTFIEVALVLIGMVLSLVLHKRKTKKDKIKWQTRLNNSISRIANEASMKVGQAYFDTVSTGIMNLTKCDYVMIGQLDYEDGSGQPFIKSHTIYDTTGKIDNIKYYVSSMDVLRASGIESGNKSMNHMSPPKEEFNHKVGTNIASPLISSKGSIIGVVACMWTKELEDNENIRAMMQIFTGRCQSELERIITEDKLFYKANYDSLTGLPNRGYMINDINEIIAECDLNKETPLDRYHVYFIDLDDFKEINDEFGHDAGDALLKEISNRLQECVSDKDVVARLGGDEFVIVEHTHNSAPDLVADKIIDKLSSTVTINHRQLSVTGSIGYVEVPGDTIDESDILKYADFAMYTAKALGKNKSVKFTKELFSQSREEKSMENLLVEAIENKDIGIAIQPLIGTKDGNVVKGEVLARWESEGAPVPADKFIALAEKRGLINALGRLIFEKGVEYCAKLKNEDQIYARLCINCSTIQLKDPEFIPFAANMVKQHNISTKQITIEITETVLSDEDSIMSSLVQARDLGFEIAIDDFGTGYSSISFLEHLPINTVKVDRSLVDGAEHDEKMRIVLKSIAEICKAYKYKIVAEGVENKADCDYLKTAGYDMIQGYYFSKPLTEDKYLRYLKDHS